MAGLVRFLKSSIIKKQLMALTGFLLVFFLIGHLAGNLLLIISAEAFNKYAHALVSNPLIYVAEAGLALLFLAHLGMAIRLTLENKKARPTPYAMKVNTGRGSTFASSTMIYTGSVIMVFLVLHINHFKFGTQYLISYEGVEMRDIYRTVVEYFASPLHVLWYLVAMSCIAIHLTHGIQSVFQTFGWNHPKYTPLFHLGGRGMAFFLALGFSSLALWSFFQGA